MAQQRKFMVRVIVLAALLGVLAGTVGAQSGFKEHIDLLSYSFGAAQTGSETIYNVFIGNPNEEAVSDVTVAVNLPAACCETLEIAHEGWKEVAAGDGTTEDILTWSYSSGGVEWAMEEVPGNVMVGPFALKVEMEGAFEPVEVVTSWGGENPGETTNAIETIEDATAETIVVGVENAPPSSMGGWIVSAGVGPVPGNLPTDGTSNTILFTERYARFAFFPSGDWLAAEADGSAAPIPIPNLIEARKGGNESASIEGEEVTALATYDVQLAMDGTAILTVPLGMPTLPYTPIEVWWDYGDGLQQLPALGMATEDGLHATFPAPGDGNYVLTQVSHSFDSENFPSLHVTPSSGDSIPLEEVSFSYGKIEWKYIEQGGQNETGGPPDVGYDLSVAEDGGGGGGGFSIDGGFTLAFTPDEAVTMTAIALAESGGNTSAYLPESSHDTLVFFLGGIPASSGEAFVVLLPDSEGNSGSDSISDIFVDLPDPPPELALWFVPTSPMGVGANEALTVGGNQTETNLLPSFFEVFWEVASPGQFSEVSGLDSEMTIAEYRNGEQPGGFNFVLGDEVLIEFDQGDVDQPVIVGRLYNEPGLVLIPMPIPIPYPNTDFNTVPGQAAVGMLLPAVQHVREAAHRAQLITGLSPTGDLIIGFPPPTKLVLLVFPPSMEQCILAAEDAINLRGGPGVEYPLVGSLAQQSAAADGKANDSNGELWFHLVEGSWVSASVVTANAACFGLLDIPAPPPPQVGEGTTQTFPVCHCEHIGGGTFQWHSCVWELDENGVPVSETVSEETFTGTWVEGCPGVDLGGGSSGGDDGGSSQPPMCPRRCPTGYRCDPLTGQCCDPATGKCV